MVKLVLLYAVLLKVVISKKLAIINEDLLDQYLVTHSYAKIVVRLFFINNNSYPPALIIVYIVITDNIYIYIKLYEDRQIVQADKNKPF